MICSHDMLVDSGARGGFWYLAKVEPLISSNILLYPTQAKGYRIKTQNEMQYEFQC